MSLNDLTNSDWIALSSVTIALSALAVSIWQGYIAMRHNKLSAQPNLRSNFVVSDDDVSAVIINDGLGPAFLDDLEFWNGQKEFNFFDDSFTDFVDLFKNPGPEDTEFYIQRVPRGTSIAVGQEFLLFRSINPSKTPAHFSALNDLLPRLKFNAKYSSIYKEKFETL